MKARLIAMLALTLFSQLAKAQTTTRSYIIKTQEHRESTRWTLTEWLRIKERVKLMDVWLAIFSNPQKDRHFRPEFNLSYGVHRGHVETSGEHKGDKFKGRFLRAQLWLTNIVTATLGLRMLNVDIGAEGYLRMSDNAYSLFSGTSSINDFDISSINQITAQHNSFNVRLFGDSIQDSSLVAKIGSYSVANTMHIESISSAASTEKGRFIGAELQVYLNKVIGMEGNYHEYQEQNNEQYRTSLGGHYFDYGFFVEASLFRFYLNSYEEKWKIRDEQGRHLIKGSGYSFGTKIQI